MFAKKVLVLIAALFAITGLTACGLTVDQDDHLTICVRLVEQQRARATHLVLRDQNANTFVVTLTAEVKKGLYCGNAGQLLQAEAKLPRFFVEDTDHLFSKEDMVKVIFRKGLETQEVMLYPFWHKGTYSKSFQLTPQGVSWKIGT